MHEFSRKFKICWVKANQNLVRIVRLELTSREALRPEHSVFTNSTISARPEYFTLNKLSCQEQNLKMAKICRF